MDSLQNLMKDRLPAQPPEVKIIKDYIQAEFNALAEVMVRDKDIVISVSSSALANSLRLRSPKIKDLCQTDKKLNFRII